MGGLNGRILTIHPMWAMDEYAMVFHVRVWLRVADRTIRFIFISL